MTLQFRIAMDVLIGFVLVFLKLLGVIDWSWWWVTLPFWGGLALTAVILCVILCVFLIDFLVAWLSDKRIH